MVIMTENSSFWCHTLKQPITSSFTVKPRELINVESGISFSWYPIVASCNLWKFLFSMKILLYHKSKPYFLIDYDIFKIQPKVLCSLYLIICTYDQMNTSM